MLRQNLPRLRSTARTKETTETLRLRYLNSFENQSYGFNRGQYVEVTEALPGVGGCKPYRAWKGPGTVKLVITDSDYKPPSSTLVEKVQTAIDPTQNHGEGIGLAPIDHEVTIVAATGTTVNISTTLTFAPGWNLEESLTYIEDAIDAYYRELNSTWAREANLIVRISQNRVPPFGALRHCRYFRHDSERSGRKPHS